jgi:hypothetical protein
VPHLVRITLIRIDARRFVESTQSIFFYQWPELSVGDDSGGMAMLAAADCGFAQSPRTGGGAMAHSAVQANCAPPLCEV